MTWLVTYPHRISTDRELNEPRSSPGPPWLPLINRSQHLSAHDIDNASASSGPEDADAPVLPISSLDSTSSLMAFPPPSSDDLLAVQLPADTSSTSIDGFEPLSPIMETDPYVDDPFTGKKSDPMLAIPIFRLTVSAPSSPPHKFASTKRDDWALLHPSASDPTGVGSY